jgi:predicted metal-dependent hydrolase
VVLTLKYPTPEEFWKAIELYGELTKYDYDYYLIMHELDKMQVREYLRNGRLDCKHVLPIRSFLTLWGGRGRPRWNDLKDRATRLNKAFEGLEELWRSSILSLNLDKLEVKIEQAFKKVNAGPVFTSKVLHLLLPEVFVMWDGDIIECKRDLRQFFPSVFVKSPSGYIKFLLEMKDFAYYLVEEIGSEEIEKKTKEIQEKANKSYPHLKPRAKTLAKLIDEFNWTKAHGLENTRLK